MGLYNNTNNVLSPIAGRGKAEYGASTVRTGTITVTASTTVGGSAVGNVVFSDPMPDADYLIELETASPMAGIAMHVEADKTSKTGFGFRVVSVSSSGAGQSIPVKYTAYKLYTDNEYNTLLNDVEDIKNRNIVVIGTTPSSVNTEGVIPFPTGVDGTKFIVTGFICKNANGHWYSNVKDYFNLFTTESTGIRVTILTGGSGYLDQTIKILGYLID